jgi:SNF2 family DNA or RNA helicase
MVVDGSPKYLSIMLREKNHPQYRRCTEWLRSEGFRHEPSNGKWWLRDQHKVLNFLSLNRKRLELDYDPGYTEGFRQRTASIQPVQLDCRTDSTGDGYSLRLELRAGEVDIRDIRNSLVSGCHYIVRDDGIHLIEKETLDKFASVSRSLGGDPSLPMSGIFQMDVSGANLVDTASVLEELEIEAELPEDWTARSSAIREVGTAWLWHLYRNQLGGILADEMGLGKTIQAIGLILSWKREGIRDGPVLVIAPASLLGNWKRELATWAPDLDVYMHHGPSRLKAFWAEDEEPDVCLTSYSTLRNDSALFHGHSFSLAIADEAQHVKNRRTHAARSLREIHAGPRFVLTGTPIENSIEDLRALFDFCLPGYLKRLPSDCRGDDRAWHDKRHLEMAAPYILRRGKKMVAPELPDKIEQTIWCGLEDRQMDLYHSVRQKSQQVMMELAEAGASENRMRFGMLTELLRLRQVCADPGMVDPDFPIEEAGKFKAFRELLEEAMDGGHRILVFS